MSEAIRKLNTGNTNHSSKVIQLRAGDNQHLAAVPVMTEWIEMILSDPQFEETVKSYVEGKIMDAFFQTRGAVSSVDNPFDAIYISELRMDPINRADLQALQAARNIEDLSGTIHFADDWDD